MLILHTVGAKSGESRQNPMAYQPGEDGGEFYVFASNNGGDHSSGWYYNALAHPGKVSVEIGGDRYPVTVRDVVGEERDRIYARQAERYENFAEYERKTTRVIPILGLPARISWRRWLIHKHLTARRVGDSPRNPMRACRVLD
jgi:deazaflavin-dependent oxidoreductase (nitroreductase family)